MKKSALLFLLSFIGFNAFGQEKYELPNVPANLASPSNSSLTLPRVSQGATLSQTIGITEIKLEYHRPGIYGRNLFEGAGSLAPYGQVWRAGANENTTISFSHSVKLNGETVEAGKYGLFLIPQKEHWTVILSKSNSDWGTFFYDQSNDALRTDVQAIEIGQEDNWLNYYFESPQYDRVDLTMVFGLVQIQIPIQVDVNEVVVESLRKELKGQSLRNLVAYNQAAEFCLLNRINLDEALAWSQRATRNDRSFTYLMTESGILRALGKAEDADRLKEEAFDNATAGDLVNYAFQLMGPKLDTNRDSGLEAIEKARETGPTAAFPMFAMGQFYETQPNRSKDDIKLAIKYYGMARDNTQVEGLKRGMNQRIALLEKEYN